MMIRYTLNYIEDLRNEILVGKKIICVGIDDTTKRNIEKISWLMEDVDYWVTYTEEKTYFILDTSICAHTFNELPNLCDERHILLIVSEYVDYIKHFLYQIAPKISVEMVCYTFKFNTRNYSEEYIHNHRWKEVAWYWTNYYLNAIDSSNKMIELQNKSDLLERGTIRVLPRVIFVLTTACNLKCKDCIALTTYYKNPYHVSSDVICESFNKLVTVVDEITCVELLGGEPFLYPDLKKIVEHILSNPKVKFLQITTNGTAQIKNDISFLTHDKIQVRISDYSISDHVSEFSSKLNKMHVNFVTQKDIRWKSIGNLERNSKTTEELKDEYNLCFEGLNCKTVLNGKLFPCTFSSRLYDLEYASDVEYIDLINGKVTWSKILDFIMSTYSNGCRYCNMMNPNTELIQSAIQCELSQGCVGEKNGHQIKSIRK